MTGTADFTQERDAGGEVLRFSGVLALAKLDDLPDRLRAVEGPIARIDLSDVEHIDTIGAWIIHRFAAEKGATIEGLDPDGAHLLSQVEQADQPVEIRPAHVGSIERIVGEIGEATVTAGRTMIGLLAFLGATTLAFGNVILHPSKFRFNATVRRFEVVGVTALGIHERTLQYAFQISLHD